MFMWLYFIYLRMFCPHKWADFLNACCNNESYSKTVMKEFIMRELLLLDLPVALVGGLIVFG